MGTSNIKSNVVGTGSNTFRGFGIISATSLRVGSTLTAETFSASRVTATVVRGPNIKGNTVTASGITRNAVASELTSGLANIKLGAHQYIFFGAKQLEASIVPLATKVDTSVKGSIYLSSGSGKVWVFDSDTTATSVSTP